MSLFRCLVWLPRFSFVAFFASFLGFSRAEPQQKAEKGPTLVRDCRLSLWGCDNRASQDQKVEQKLLVSIMDFEKQLARVASGEDPAQYIAALQDAFLTNSDRREIEIRMASFYAESASCEKGYNLFLRLLSENQPSNASQRNFIGLSPSENHTIMLGVALCDSLRGDYDAAIARYLSMLNPTSRELDRIRYRLGEVLMAKGQLADAVTYLQPPCMNREESTLIRLRSCVALSVAYDRMKNRIPEKVIGILRWFQRTNKYKKHLQMQDYLSEGEKLYYSCDPVSWDTNCGAISLFKKYSETAPPTVPKSYVLRAQEHLLLLYQTAPGCLNTAP